MRAMGLATCLQHILPHRLLSRVVYRATRWTFGPWKSLLIHLVVHRYHVDMDEADPSDIHDYPHFNAFFTRRLAPGARPITSEPGAIACPADGRISQAGGIRAGRIIQAKGMDFSVAELLADGAAANAYRDGHFVTIYLSPRDYHRVHMPLDGTLVGTAHIPGRIFSVAPFAVQSIPRLFARNERLACHFQGSEGPFAVIMVGAMLVSSISTVWGGLTVPPYAHAVTHEDLPRDAVHLKRGDPMGNFNMGSTVIVLLPPGTELELYAEGQSVRMGQRIGTWMPNVATP